MNDGGTTGSAAERRLNSWKEIAAFFGRDERTVKRWETARGLPVRRVPGGTRTPVFAYVSELEAWLGTPRPAVVPATPAAVTASLLSADRPTPRRGLLLGVAVLAIAVLTAGIVAFAGNSRAVAEPPAAAQALYRQGVAAWSSRTAAGFREAIDRFQDALVIAPDYARAYAGLANVYNLISQYTSEPAAPSYATARIAAEKALALDPNLPEAYAALGFNAFYGARDYARSAALFEKSLALAPDDAQTLHWYALSAMHLGDFARPLELIEHALELQPDSRSIRANTALIRFHAGRPDEAIALLEQLRQAQPDYLAVPSYLATIYLDLGRYGDFLAEYETAARIEDSTGHLAIAAAARRALPGGGEAMLAAMFAEQQVQFAAGAEPAYKLAATAAMLGHDEEALDLLDTAAADGEPDLIGLRIDHAFIRLRDHPRFVALVEKLGLIPVSAVGSRTRG